MERARRQCSASLILSPPPLLRRTQGIGQGAAQPAHGVSPSLQELTNVALVGKRQDLDDVKLPPGQPGLIHVRAKTVNDQSWQPKTRSNRAVPISTDLRAFLDASTPRPSIGEWYFPNRKGLRRNEDDYSGDLRAANRRACLVWTYLDFRHTFDSQLVQRGLSLYKISRLMGNAPEICRRHYAALTPASLGTDVRFPATTIGTHKDAS